MCGAPPPRRGPIRRRHAMALRPNARPASPPPWRPRCCPAALASLGLEAGALVAAARMAGAGAAGALSPPPFCRGAGPRSLFCWPAPVDLVRASRRRRRWRWSGGRAGRDGGCSLGQPRRRDRGPRQVYRGREGAVHEEVHAEHRGEHSGAEAGHEVPARPVRPRSDLQLAGPHGVRDDSVAREAPTEEEAAQLPPPRGGRTRARP